jgi:kinesin family member 11
MQGDLLPTPMGNPSIQAGMIPRVLFRLFHQLEVSNADYSVKISYVELYNEELRDLLASDLVAPSGSTQPMAQGMTKDAPVLKIFDDSSKKGVFIQGLEDSPVKDRADALALLTKGSQRRQIAATKFNDHSSRSHSIFTITVHVKETSSIGDDLLKVGKLNLVDLAGSENIGRSGAENKRAREAGMINQSLLTLGRVINALVDKSTHVPYRYALSFSNPWVADKEIPENRNSLDFFKTPLAAVPRPVLSRQSLLLGAIWKKRSRLSTTLFVPNPSGTNQR